MVVNFDEKDYLTIYGFFLKKIKEIKKIAEAPDCPLSKKDIKSEIKRFSVITDKIESVYPRLAEMKKYDF